MAAEWKEEFPLTEPEKKKNIPVGGLVWWSEEVYAQIETSLGVIPLRTLLLVLLV